MLINFNNVENLIFENNDLKIELSNHKDFFNYYFFYKKIGDLNKIKKLKINFLSSIDENDLNIIKKYLKEEVSVQKISNNITENFSFNLFDSFPINNFDHKDFCVYREDKKLYVTLWR